MNTSTDTGTVPRLEQLELFSGVCPVQKSTPNPKLHRALTPREKDILKQVRAFNDPLIIEAINLFHAEVRDVINPLGNQRAGSAPPSKPPQV
jgi:hypothetical protein